VLLPFNIATDIRRDTAMTPKNTFPPLEEVTSPLLSTASAAYYLNRANQTLREWACFETGPIRPVRINGRLSWKTSDVRALVAGLTVLEPTPKNPRLGPKKRALLEGAL